MSLRDKDLGAGEGVMAGLGNRQAPVVDASVYLSAEWVEAYMLSLLRLTGGWRGVSKLPLILGSGRQELPVTHPQSARASSW